MAKNTIGLSHELIIHPGASLKEALEERNMSQEELATRCDVSPKHVSEVISGKKNISNKFAVCLEVALGIKASFWINLQGIYDREMLELKEISNIDEEEMDVLAYLKEIVSYCEKNELIPKCENAQIKILNMRKFLNVNKLTKIPDLPLQQVAFRGTKNTVNVYVLYAWQKICDNCTNKIVIAEPFNKDLLMSKFVDIKSTMFLEPYLMVQRLKEIFKECGVAFEIVRNFKGAPVQGFIKKNGDKISLCMTLRQKFIDIFWFTLFHELAHLINGDFKDQYIDYSFIESTEETRADNFAQDVLIDKNAFEEFFLEGDYSISRIEKFSKKENVLPTIVIGRLQKELNDYKYLTNLKEKYIWAK